MPISARFDDPVQMLLDVVALEETSARTHEDIYIGHSHEMPGGRIFGGQVLAQTVTAASQTVPDDQFVHSMHGYFLRPGDVNEDVTYGVDRIHDGRSFTRRRVQGYQHGVPIFSGILSFQGEEQGFEHHAPMPDVPQPEDLPNPQDEVGRNPMSTRTLAANPIELRHVNGHLLSGPDPHPSPRQAVWMRLRRPIGDDRRLHQATLAYLSDYTIQETPLRAAGLSWATPKLSVASLDHAIWWHRPGRTDDWLLYAQEASSAGNGRGLAIGRIYTRTGVLLATATQEIMERVPPSSTATDLPD